MYRPAKPFGTPASCTLTVQSYRTCAARLKPGEVKRVPQRSAPLIGYMIACPSCGLVAPYLDREMGYIEDPPKGVPVRDTQVRRRLTDTTGGRACHGCALMLRVQGGVLEAYELVVQPQLGG
jgi:hypothetical protein